jgi:CheY-like chemotaxis protein
MRQQACFSGIPVIAVTAHAMVTELQSFLKARCNACISKPIDFKLLSPELERCLAPLPKSPSRVDSSVF